MCNNRSTSVRFYGVTFFVKTNKTLLIRYLFLRKPNAICQISTVVVYVKINLLVQFIRF